MKYSLFEDQKVRMLWFNMTPFVTVLEREVGCLVTLSLFRAGYSPTVAPLPCSLTSAYLELSSKSHCTIPWEAICS